MTQGGERVPGPGVGDGGHGRRPSAADGGESAAALGAVLAGGRSSRFGRDKASEPVDGVASLERVRGMLEAVVDRVVVIGGPESDLGEPRPGEGPLQAVVAALREARAAGCDRAVVLACDLPWVDLDTVTRLAATLGDGPARGWLGRVPRVGGRLQVLSAAWSVLALEGLEAAMASGERSLTRWVTEREADFETSDAWDARALGDFDTAEDLQRGLAAHDQAPTRPA